MELVNSKDLANFLQSTSNVVDVDIDNVCTDSRYVKKGDLFVAIKGEKFDGHDFVEDILNHGAEIAVVERLLPNVPTVRQIVVSNTKEAFAKIGLYNRLKFKGKVIALTGSAGKTTTKEEIKFILSKFASTYATVGNYNNDIGVPKTLCDLDMNAEYAIIEVGMSAKGEISSLMNAIRPDIAIVTNVYPMHIEFFNSEEDIALAKAEIFEGLSKNGIALINGDSNYFDVLLEKSKRYTNNLKVYNKDDILSIKEDYNTKVEACVGGKKVSFELDSIGIHNVYNALCALNVADILGLDIQKAADSLKEFGAVEGRGKKYKLNIGGAGSYTLIDDSYSGQPEAMRIAIKSLGQIKSLGRKIAVVGKMAELGEHSLSEHLWVAKTLAETDIDIIVAVCPEAKVILNELNDRQKSFYFETIDGLADFLINKLLQNNDIVLIKGARYSSQLYKVAEALIESGKV